MTGPFSVIDVDFIHYSTASYGCIFRSEPRPYPPQLYLCRPPTASVGHDPKRSGQEAKILFVFFLLVNSSINGTHVERKLKFLSRWMSFSLGGSPTSGSRPQEERPRGQGFVCLFVCFLLVNSSINGTHVERKLKFLSRWMSFSLGGSPTSGSRPQKEWPGSQSVVVVFLLVSSCMNDAPIERRFEFLSRRMSFLLGGSPTSGS